MKAQINIDTENKTISMVVDGQIIEDIANVSAYKDKYGFSCSFSKNIDKDSSESYHYTAYATQGAYASLGFDNVDQNILEMKKILANIK